MGIKYFFKWFRESFPKVVTKAIIKNQNILPKEDLNNPNLLLLDLNGMIHTSCQKIYKYGSFESKALLIKTSPVSSEEQDLRVFEDVLNSITALLAITQPKEIVLCIDGVAPISKQIQQRQRRFLSKKTEGGFDSNCISPGTEFLYKLGIYIKTNIKSKLETEWFSVETIYFMDSLVPGEGEHKLYDFLRSNKANIIDKKFNIIIVGNDADLIMLSLLVSTLFIKENLIYILREDFILKNSDYLLVDINQFKKCILDFAMTKPNFKHYDFDFVVCDFVILCFMVGNDFLPPLPLFNIYDGGLDLVMKYYFTSKGYITFKLSKQTKVQINFKYLISYFDYILNVACPQAVQHYKTREYGYPNTLLDIASKKEASFKDIAIHYLKSYTLNHKITKNLVKIYLTEIEWVFNYYAYGSGTVDWNMYYPSQFAPTCINVSNYLKTNKNILGSKELEQNHLLPFFQLLCILPPHSADLLPPPFDKVLTDKMVQFHPEKIEIDFEGKLNEWEGIPLLPPLDHKQIFTFYKENIDLCDKKDLVRNKIAKQLKFSVVN